MKQRKLKSPKSMESGRGDPRKELKRDKPQENSNNWKLEQESWLFPHQWVG
jgi:hypothetical protein